MREVLLAQDGVLVSYVEALLRDAGIEFAVLDRNLHSMQIVPGWMPHRVMVRADQSQRAQQILRDAGLQDYLTEVSQSGNGT
jgi:hypothetical protein